MISFFCGTCLHYLLLFVQRWWLNFRCILHCCPHLWHRPCPCLLRHSILYQLLLQIIGLPQLLLEVLCSYSRGASRAVVPQPTDHPLNFFLCWYQVVNLEGRYGHRDVLPQGWYMKFQHHPLSVIRSMVSQAGIGVRLAAALHHPFIMFQYSLVGRVTILVGLLYLPRMSPSNYDDPPQYYCKKMQRN